MNTDKKDHSIHSRTETKKIAMRAVNALPRILATAALVAIALLVQSCSRTQAGPNGGDVVALNDGKTNAEVLANPGTGEVMVHTWDQELKSPRPIEAKPLTVGAEQNSVRLDPHPMPGDPPGYCSRFYGQADWLRGGQIHRGWMSQSESGVQPKPFDLNRCWQAGKSHGEMWSEMPRHGMHHGGPGDMHDE